MSEVWDFGNNPNGAEGVYYDALDGTRKSVADALNAPQVPSYTVASLPAASPAGRVIYVSDETGGATLAFSDGTDWRRVTDRAVVS